MNGFFVDCERLSPWFAMPAAGAKVIGDESRCHEVKEGVNGSNLGRSEDRTIDTKRLSMALEVELEGKPRGALDSHLHFSSTSTRAGMGITGHTMSSARIELALRRVTSSRQLTGHGCEMIIPGLA